jgi:acyl-CoA synthetase (NDP forming)
VNPSQTSTSPTTELDRTLNPAGIAIVGASSREGAISSRFVHGLLQHGYGGRVVAVNPRHDEVLGLKCFPDVAAAAAEGPVDIALVSLPAAKVLAALEECHQAGIAGAVIFSSGFSEMGEEGQRQQEKLTELAQRTGMRLLGPNSPGFINVADSVCLTSLRVSFRDSLVPGNIGLIAQSGGVMGLVMERAFDSGAGISAGVATGNEADLAAADVIPWFAAHEATRVLAMYLEGIRKPEALIAGFEAMREAGKPIVMLKAGATDAGARATAAHTGALASADDVVDALLRRYGVIRVESFDEMTDVAATLGQSTTTTGNRVGIITTSGGGGVAAAEGAERAGLEIPRLGKETAEVLRELMPDIGSVENPADVSGMFIEDPVSFQRTLETFADAPEFDAAVMVITGQQPDFSEELADRLVALREAGVRPPAVLWPAGQMSRPARVRLRQLGFDVFEDADRGMTALAARWAVASFAYEEQPAPEPVEPPAAGARMLETETMSLLAAAGVPTATSMLCASAEDAAAAAAGIDGPVAVKAAARDLLHKSDAGAVVLGLESAEEVVAAHERVVAAAREAGAEPEGSVVQEMAGAGVELILGARRDPQFGPVLVVGPGGVVAELIGDVSRRLLPLRPGEARAMLEELRLFPLLDGYRGAEPADLDAACAAIEGFARVAAGLGERLEAIEVNPLLVHPRGRGATAVDALALLDEASI